MKSTAQWMEMYLGPFLSERPAVLRHIVEAVSGTIQQLETDLTSAREQLTTAQHEVAEMDAVFRVIVPEVMARLTSSCVWCGEASPEGLTAEGLSEHIRQHLATCQKHPIRAVERERDTERQLREGLAQDFRKALDECESLHRAEVREMMEQVGEATRTAETRLAERNATQAELDAALADNAATLDIARRTVEALATFSHPLLAVTHNNLRDVVAQRHLSAALLEVIHAIRQYQRVDEPDVGVTFRRLLEERGRIAHMIDPGQHRTALVRAKNEGLEEAAKEVLAYVIIPDEQRRPLAQRIRSKKAPES